MRLHRPEVGVPATTPVRSPGKKVTVDRCRVILAMLGACLALSTQQFPVRAAGGAVLGSATGSGQTIVLGELRTFSFAVRIDADGVATGMAQVDNRSIGEMFQLKIDCLAVLASIAIVSGVITRHTDTNAIGLTGIFAVQDSGEGSAGPPDLVTQVFFFRPGAVTCSDLGPADAAPFLIPIDAGNVQVM